MWSTALRRGLNSVTRSAGVLRASAGAWNQPNLARYQPIGARYLGAGADTSKVLPKVKEGVPGETPSILDQATGLERGEIEHPDLFKHNEVLVGHFGTAENPVKIQSAFDSRIVGCTGHASPNDHDLLWYVGYCG